MQNGFSLLAIFFSGKGSFTLLLGLHCPFCDAPAEERVPGVDESGQEVVLLMFGCPFFIKMPQSLTSNGDAQLQKYLDEWRRKDGDAWLESIGPILKNRELRNINRKRNQSSAS